jgi:hypothetical protein
MMARQTRSFQHSRSRYQRGVAAVLTSVMLLFAASIAVLYLNRSLIFEQRTSANYVRSTSALEMAEAGIEWATGMLNQPWDITTDCSFLTTTNTSYRKKYVLTNWGNGSSTATYVASASTTYPGCKVNGTTLTCSCPAVGSAPSLGTATLPGFTVAFSDVSGDTAAVQITSTGCTDKSSACTAANASTADSAATVRVILKMRPLLRAAPASSLTCGGSCAVGGAYTIINTDLNTNGTLVNSGSSITSGNGTTYTTLPGVPTANALVSSDTSLTSLYNADPTCSNSTLFNAYFGSTITQYAASPETKSITCTSANTCGTAVTAAYGDGWRSFYFPSGFYWNSSSGGNLGTQSDPVTIVTPSTFDINGNISIYGMVFSNDSVVNDFGTGTANVYGGMVTCGAYNNNGSGTLQYDSTVLSGAQKSSAMMVRIPGSWRDW